MSSSLRIVLVSALVSALGCRPGSGPAEATTSAPEAGASHERELEREGLVMKVEARGVRDPLVLEALRRVPRHAFVPEDVRSQAYEDCALPIGLGQTISQPTVVGMMTEAVRLSADSKVLEIGTGSGYQAAVLAEITPHVFSIEIDPELARRARIALDACGYGAIHTRTGDGYAGWPEEAPFDAILITAAPPSLPAPLLEQLAPGGRLCAPVGETGGDQELVLVTRDGEGSFREERLGAVRFVPMTGEAQRAPR